MRGPCTWSNRSRHATWCLSSAGTCRRPSGPQPGARCRRRSRVRTAQLDAEDLLRALGQIRSTVSDTNERQAQRFSDQMILNGDASAGEELLAAVHVVGRAGESRVGHEVDGERGDVARFDDAPDGERGAELVAAVVEFVA